jgi:hypothetical protein
MKQMNGNCCVHMGDEPTNKTKYKTTMRPSPGVTSQSRVSGPSCSVMVAGSRLYFRSCRAGHSEDQL